MQKTLAIAIVSAAAVVGLSAGPLMAGFIPPALPAGSQYQLLFVTEDEVDATSSDIDDYNSFASGSAGLNSLLPAATWKAIVSTPTMDASTNAPWAGLPVYNTQGILLTDATGLYHAASASVAPVNYDQFGSLATDGVVWTGTHNSGIGVPGNELGNGGTFALTGVAFSDWQWLGNAFDLPEELHPIYALSGPITIPAPEPGGAVLLGSALVLIGASRRLRERRRVD